MFEAKLKKCFEKVTREKPDSSRKVCSSSIPAFDVDGMCELVLFSYRLVFESVFHFLNLLPLRVRDDN